MSDDTITILDSEAVAQVIVETTATMAIVENNDPVTIVLSELIPGPQGMQGAQGIQGEPGPSTNILVSRTNVDGDDFFIGMPLAAGPGATDAVRAQANTSNTKTVIGLVFDPTIIEGSTGHVQVAGLMTLTTAQWDGVTGMIGGLVPGAVYFLDPYRPGALRTDPPQTPGFYQCPVGRALSPTDLIINIGPTILL